MLEQKWRRCSVRTGIRTVTDLMERRFAEFAGVPYQNPLSRQQWEELWETEADEAKPQPLAAPPIGGIVRERPHLQNLLEQP
jgi:hypothetical protein